MADKGRPKQPERKISRSVAQKPDVWKRVERAAEASHVPTLLMAAILMQEGLEAREKAAS